MKTPIRLMSIFLLVSVLGACTEDPLIPEKDPDTGQETMPDTSPETSPDTTPETTPEEWVSIGKGTLIDDAVSPVLDLPVAVLEVEVQKHREQEGLYRVVDPYKTASFYKQYASETTGELIMAFDETTGAVHLQKTRLGLKDKNGEFTIAENPERYGFMDTDNKYFRFNSGILSLQTGSAASYPVSENGFFCLVLPGGNLPVMDQFDIKGISSYADENGVDQIKLELFVHMNCKQEIYYKFYDTDISFNEEWNKYLSGEVQMTKLEAPEPGKRNNIVFTPAKSAMYSVIVAGKNTAGEDFCQADMYNYLKEGDSVPEPTVSLSAKQNPNYPEGELFLNIKTQEQIKFYRIQYAPVDDPENRQMPLLYFAPDAELQSTEGAVVNLTNLEHSTTYQILVEITALDDQKYVYQTYATTAPEPSYTLLGEGTFIDNTQFVAWTDAQGQMVFNYESPVQIYQDVTNPDKFRMMTPYKKYWENTDPAFVQNQLPLHSGYESAYVDFYRYVGPDGRVHVAFSEIDTGVAHAEFPGSSHYYGALGQIGYNVNVLCFVQSIEESDGVFLLNPISTYLRPTNQYYGLLDFGKSLQIRLPGKGESTDPEKPQEGIAFDYFEVPQTLQEKSEYKYILHRGETYSSHQQVRNYSACYDTRRHNPMWVAYPCHQIWWEGGYGRPVEDPWRPDPQMEESEQSIIYASDWSDWPWSSNNGKPTDTKHYWTPYNASFYFTKGHLMRSAERGTRDKYNLFKMNEQTFYPTNISPERYPTVRAGKKKVTHWGLIEGIMPNEWRCSDTLYVVAGCYYGDDAFKAMDASDNGNKGPGSKDCVVPVARWKVFLRTKSGSTGKPVSECRADELMSIAFWFPQSLDYSNQVSELPPLAQYTLSVNELEAKIGGEFNFFPQVPDEVCNSFNVADWPQLNKIFNVKLDANYNGDYIY